MPGRYEKECVVKAVSMICESIAQAIAALTQLFMKRKHTLAPKIDDIVIDISTAD